MCKGLAVIAEKTTSWQIYAKKGISSHDELLHELRDDLRYGKTPHIKFEVLFPNRVHDDIQQDLEYPETWIEVQWGKKIACKDAFCAVSKYLHENPELLEFTPEMFQGANLSNADLSKANLSDADLSKADLSDADLSKADLRWANLSKADLSKADLRWANLSNANLSKADLSKADLSKANLSNADLSNADLSNADLSDADLSNANLIWANLTNAETEGSIFPENYKKKV